jgi:hypothetical protein
MAYALLCHDMDTKHGEDMGENNWRELCERIMRETDPEKLISLVEQLNVALDERERELRRSGRRHSP